MSHLSGKQVKIDIIGLEVGINLFFVFLEEKLDYFFDYSWNVFGWYRVDLLIRLLNNNFNAWNNYNSRSNQNTTKTYRMQNDNF